MKPAILVVEDDQKTVDLIRLYLEKDGFRVLVAYDGYKAIDVARNSRPGLIILDLMPPKIDGFGWFSPTSLVVNQFLEEWVDNARFPLRSMT